MGISLVSFDIWDTLLKSNPVFKDLQIKLFAQKSGFNNIPELLSIKERIDREINRLSETSGKDYGFEYRLKEISKSLLPNNNPPDIDFDTTYMEMEELFLSHPPSFIQENLLHILAEIKKKNIHIALLSNTGFIKGYTMRKFLALSGIMEFIDFAVFSNEVGHTKPHPAIFDFLISQCSIPAHQILHIGDNMIADYEGAKKNGFKSVFFSKNIIFAQDTKQINSLETILLSL